MDPREETEQQIALLRSRLDALDRQLTAHQQENERRLARLEAATAPLESAPASMPPPPPIGAVRLNGPGAPPAPREPHVSKARPAQMNPDWEVLIRWAGLLLLALAAIFLVSTSISRGWIGPNLQLAAATVGGLSLLAGAVHFAPRLRAWAITMGIGGAVVLPFCGAAAHGWLDLVSENVALVLIVLSLVVSLGVGYYTHLDEISIVSLLAGLSVPAGFGYLDIEPFSLVAWWTAGTALTAAALGWVRRSTILRLSGVIAAGAALLVAAGISVDRGVDVFTSGLGPVILITAMMWLGPAVADRIGGHRWAGFDHWTVALAPGFTWITVIALRSRGEESPWFDAGLIGLVMAGCFLIGLVTTMRFLPRSVSLAHFLGASALATASLVAMVEGPVLVVALAAQATFTFILGHYLDDRITEAAAALLGTAAAVLTGAGMVDGLANEGATLGEGLAHLLVVVLIAAAAGFHWTVNERELAGALGITAWVGALTWLASVLINLPQGQAAISVAWAIMAAGATALGVASHTSAVRTTGLVTLTVVVGKLLTIDLGEVDVFWRVGVFVLVGSGLLRLAYVLPRYETEGSAAEKSSATEKNDHPL